MAAFTQFTSSDGTFAMGCALFCCAYDIRQLCALQFASRDPRRGLFGEHFARAAGGRCLTRLV